MTHESISRGDAAMSILHRHGGTLDDAVERLNHIDFGTKADMRATIAYLACQVSAYRQIANEDAALAMCQIKNIADAYALKNEVAP